MASYKVIQDVEDEDRLLGPLTMKQFIYAMMATALGGLGWMIGKYSSYYLAIPAFLAMAPFLFLALPLRRDQPNDVWLLARLNFLFKPRTRLWSRMGGSGSSVHIVSSREEGPPAETSQTREEIEAKVRDLGRILDSRGQQAAADHREAEADADHELQKSALNRRFKGLLRHHKNRRLENLEAEMRKTLRSQEYLLSQYAPGGASTESRPVAEDLSERLDSIAGSGNLKISTLESLVGATKVRPRKA